MVFVFIFVSLITFVFVRVSILCVFWVSKSASNKMQVYTLYFPYYIIVLTILCATFIYQSNLNEFAFYYFGSIYIMALLIWKFEIKKDNNKNFAVEPNHSKSL